MKKKVVVALLTMCMVLTAAACGNETEKKSDTKQETSSDQEENSEQETGEPETEEAKTEEQKSEEPKKTDSSATRLVTVSDVEKYIKLGEYKGIELENTVQEVTDNDVQTEIDYELESHAEEAAGAEAQNGDLITINFAGTMDGEAFDGGTADNYDMTLGEAGMIEGFEDGIVGMKKGETRSLDLTFPEDYYEESLAGKPVVFKITLQAIRRIPELTDEWTAANMGAATVDEYRANVRAKLEENAKEQAKYMLRENAWSAVTDASEIIEFPQADIDNASAEYKKLCEDFAEQADMNLEDFVEAQGMTMESFEDQCVQYAELKVKQNLVIQAIMDAEGLTLDDEECLAIQDELIQYYSVSDLADLIDEYGQVAVDEAIGLLRVEDFIIENAKVTEKVANGDLVGENADADEAAAQEEEAVVEEPEDADGTEEVSEGENVAVENGDEEA